MPDYEYVDYPTLTHTILDMPAFEESEDLREFDAIIFSLWRSAQEQTEQLCNGLAHSVRLASQRYRDFLPDESLSIYRQVKAVDFGDMDIAEHTESSARARLAELSRSGAVPIVIDCSEGAAEKLLKEVYSGAKGDMSSLRLPRNAAKALAQTSALDTTIVMADAGVLIGQYHQDGIPRFSGMNAAEFLDTLRFLAANGACGLCFTEYQESDIAAHLLSQAIIHWLAGMAMRRQDI